MLELKLGLRFFSNDLDENDALGDVYITQLVLSSWCGRDA